MQAKIFRATLIISIAAIASSCGNRGEDKNNSFLATSDTEQGEKLALASDEAWINLEGSVVSVSPASFLLDYGDGNVVVEMDDWDFFQEGRHLKAGDRVAVTGRVDRDLLAQATLEASSVYVENLGTYFYASGRDEEDLAVSSIYTIAPAGSVDATGFVTTIEGREFSIGTAAGAMRVDTSRMQQNPLDAEGNPQVKIGDRVYVWGRIDLDGREEKELMADGLVLLRPDRGKSVAGDEPAGSNRSSTATANQAEPAQ